MSSRHRACVAKTMKKKMEREWSSQSFLDGHSKQLGDQRNLASDISFYHALCLSFPYHVHHLIPLQCSPRRAKREQAHPGPGQPFDKTMVLFDTRVEVFYLP